MEPTDWAWLAGLLEGEAHFFLDPRPNKRTARITIRQIDEDLVLKTFQLTGVGHMAGPIISNQENRQPQWTWNVGKREHVREILVNILPYMCSRRSARILEILKMYEEIETEKNTFIHGTRRGYEYSGCRCKACSEYNNERVRKNRDRRFLTNNPQVGCIPCRRVFTNRGFDLHSRQIHIR